MKGRGSRAAVTVHVRGMHSSKEIHASWRTTWVPEQSGTYSCELIRAKNEKKVRHQKSTPRGAVRTKKSDNQRWRFEKLMDVIWWCGAHESSGLDLCFSRSRLLLLFPFSFLNAWSCIINAERRICQQDQANYCRARVLSAGHEKGIHGS